MVCVCSRRISGHTAKKTNSYDIDDFINQLLSSQKFDELADKVAEKAVKKIKNIGPGDPVVEKRPEAKHSGEFGAIEQEKVKIHGSNEEEERRKVISNESHETPQNRQKNIPHDEDADSKNRERAEGSSNKDSNNNHIKINTQALMKKEDNSGQAELSLKYKYLKKHARDERGRDHQKADSSEPNPWKHLEHSKAKAQYFVPVDDKGHDDETHHAMNPDSAETNANYVKKNKKSGIRNQNRHGRYKNEHDGESHERPQFKSQPLARLPVIDIVQNIGKEEIKDETLPSKNSRQDVDAKDEAIIQGNPKRNAKDDMIWRSHHTDSERSDNEEPEKHLQQASSGVPGYELGELTTKRLIRREGDRLYTYLSGAEYADFHEEVAKQQKTKTDQLY